MLKARAAITGFLAQLHKPNKQTSTVSQLLETGNKKKVADYLEKQLALCWSPVFFLSITHTTFSNSCLASGFLKSNTFQFSYLNKFYFKSVAALHTELNVLAQLLPGRRKLQCCHQAKSASAFFISGGLYNEGLKGCLLVLISSSVIFEQHSLFLQSSYGRS